MTPFWWEPHELPEGGCEPTPFGWSCSNLEERWGMSMMAEYEEEYTQMEMAEDMGLRLVGPCERCQEPQDAGLAIVGGEAICDGCMLYEAANEPPDDGDIPHGPDGDVAF